LGVHPGSRRETAPPALGLTPAREIRCKIFEKTRFGPGIHEAANPLRDAGGARRVSGAVAGPVREQAPKVSGSEVAKLQVLAPKSLK
jgi:hypothetical protein